MRRGAETKMDIVQLVFYIFPAYVANSVPVLFSGKTPMDLNSHFLDGKRVFGSSKTVRGAAVGLFLGFASGVILAVAAPSLFMAGQPFAEKAAAAFLLSLGAISGDLLGSFAKRRMGLAPGEPFFLTDQILFVLVALLFSSLVHVPEIGELLVLLGMTFVLHVMFNIIAHRLKLKKVPW